MQAPLRTMTPARRAGFGLANVGEIIDASSRVVRGNRYRCSTTVFGQASYRSIVRTVTDQSSAAVVGATVTLTNAGTGERYPSKSGTGGNYQLLNLVSGIYRVNVERSSFKKAARENREVTVSGSTPADISRQLGGVTPGRWIGGGLANQGATYYGGFPANSALGNLVNMAPIPDSTSEFREQAELAAATHQTTRLDVNLKASTVRATVGIRGTGRADPRPGAGPGNQRHGRSSHQRCPQCDPESLFLRHAAERRPAAQRNVHQHFRRSIYDRQSASAS